ncbi:MAG: patatin-like phospholipase family protein [Clostridiales bacterium]|nr:patatin-like phospholipase family protein [Clostridiales bacterium]
MDYGLVFAGGGVRGAYHIGVWRAIKELGIKISSVCGASIGAVNAAMLCMDAYEDALRLWEEISLYDIVALPSDTKIEGDLFCAKTIASLIRQIFVSKGLEMQPLEELLRSLIDEDKIRSSKIRLGIALFSVTDKKEMLLDVSQIPEGRLVDYLMASVCLVGFKSRTIGGKRFIDGGMADNMPVSYMLKYNTKNIITVNAGGIGVYRDRNLAGRNVIEIKCRSPYTGTMDFDRNGILKSIENGALDARRALGLLGGEIYYFNAEAYRRLHFKYSHDLILGAEYAAELLGIDKLKVYDFDELVSLIKKEKDNAPLQLQRVMKMLCRDGFIESKIDNVLGGTYLAASALMYFGYGGYGEI